MSEENRKEKIEKKQNTYLTPGRRRPSRPSPPGPAWRLPQAGTLVRVGHAEAADVPGHLLLPPCHISTPGDAQELPHSIPPLLIVFPFLSRLFCRRPRRTPERRRAPA